MARKNFNPVKAATGNINLWIKWKDGYSTNGSPTATFVGFDVDRRGNLVPDYAIRRLQRKVEEDYKGRYKVAIIYVNDKPEKRYVA